MAGHADLRPLWSTGKARLVVYGPQGACPQGSTYGLSTAALAAAMKGA
ncbi:hypothetical protein ACRAWG_13625 [Methylobacterium sp. P31]